MYRRSGNSGRQAADRQRLLLEYDQWSTIGSKMEAGRGRRGKEGKRTRQFCHSAQMPQTAHCHLRSTGAQWLLLLLLSRFKATVPSPILLSAPSTKCYLRPVPPVHYRTRFFATSTTYHYCCFAQTLTIHKKELGLQTEQFQQGKQGKDPKREREERALQQ